MKHVKWQIKRSFDQWPFSQLFFSLLLFLCFTSTDSKAQFYSAGNDPASAHWKQLTEDHLRVIFQEGYEQQAITVLGYLKEMKKEAVQTMPANIPHLSVILHNQTANANGFVTWAPKRMELFTLADPNMYPQEWLRQLAVHEFRHVAQISDMRQGMTKVLSWILGEQAIGAVIGLYIPTWFLEGDAVSFETAYTHTGRGRTPSFFIPYISMLDKYGGFCYEKAVFGSYKHFVPDHYVVGYHLVSYSRFYFGDRIWKSVLDNVARRPYSIMPFSHELKKWTGMSKFKWYDWSAKQIEEKYSDRLISVKTIAHNFSTQQASTDFVSYRFPHYLNDSLIVAEKTGLSYVNEWVLLNRNGEERKVIYPGYYSLANTSVGNLKLYYTEYKFDKRWTHRLWSDVKELDLISKKKKRITRKKYAASPTVYASNNNPKLAYIEQTKTNEFSLVVKDRISKEIQHYPSPQNRMLFTPVWESDSTLVCIALNKEKGKYFVRFNCRNKQWTTLSPPLFYDINQPLVWHQYLIHRGAYENQEQLYAYDTLAHATYRVTREAYEATDPAISNNKLLFSSYSATGYVVKEQLLNPSEWIPISLQGNQWDNAITQTMSRQEQKYSTSNDSSTLHYTISKYRKVTHLFNFHSWAPLYVDINNATVNSGASAFSQNLLSTSFTTAGYLYDNTEQTGKWVLNYQYTGLYPVLAFSTSLGDRYMRRYGNWKEFIFNASVSLPFNLTHGPYTEKMTFSVLPQWQSIYNVQEHNAGGLINQDLLSVSYRFDYSRLFRLATRDLRSPKGQSIFFQYRHAPIADFSYSSFFAGAISTWLPSLWKHHSILTTVQGHHYDGGGLYLSSPIAFPRGYSYLFSKDLIRGSIDYAFPICYPDWRLTALFYIKRIKANIFYDAAWASQVGGNPVFYDSKGIDIRMDFHFANFLSPIDLGIRFYQLNNGNFINYQLLLTYQLGR